MFPAKFAADYKQILPELTINVEQPGPILRDFGVMLEFVGADGVKASGKYNLLPIDAIPILDERLSRPLHLKLKRPQLKSHPYLQGLHLLLRATGLTKVDGVGDKARLRVDPAMAKQWQRLNATEQYFTLLEAAFLHANGAMIGERHRWEISFVFDCLNEWNSLPKNGRHFDLSKDNYVGFMYRRSYLLALTDLFGLFRVEQAVPPVAPWRPQAIHHTPFGDAVFTLLREQDFLVSEVDDDSSDFGRWQAIFQPYFPQWRNNLVLPKREFRKGVFVFKASLGTMWRQIAIPDSLSLDYLAGAILDAVNFDDDHLYEFSFRDRLGKSVSINHPRCDEGPYTDEVAIGELPLDVGQSMMFLFDYGDNWKFNVKLERIDPRNPRMRKPCVLAQQGTAPKQYRDWD